MRPILSKMLVFEQLTQTNTTTYKLFIQTKLKQMKKTYIQPAIELVAVEVEQGIAASVQTGFGINSADVEDVEW